jgi:hypothetical protein
MSEVSLRPILHRPAVIFFGTLGVICLLAVIFFSHYMSIPVLSHPDTNTYRWAPRTWGYKMDNKSTLYFDNGTDQGITVVVEDQGKFVVLPHQLIKLEEPAGTITFTVTGDPVLFTAAAARDPSAFGPSAYPRTAPLPPAPDGKFHVTLNRDEVYVYNPGAHFSYEIQFHFYSSPNVPQERKDPIFIPPTTFFRATLIDYPFQPAPEMDVIYGGGISSTRTTLNRADHDPPASKAYVPTE